MISLVIPGNGTKRTLNLPTSLNEISINYLSAVTSDVVIAPNYAIVAYIISAPLGVICDTKNDKGVARAAFKLVRMNNPTNAIDIYNGQMLIAAGTDIMRGIEITSPKNILSTNKIISLVRSCDKDENGKSIKNPHLQFNTHYNTVVYTVGFKLVPLCDIHGSYVNLTEDAIKNIDDAIKTYWS